MEAPAKRRVKVLLVDDEPAIRELLKLQLSACGYDVVLAEDAFAARRLLYEAAPDVMVIDPYLPYLSGAELVSALAAESTLPWVPVIFLAGRVEAASLVELVERVTHRTPVVTPRGDVDAHAIPGAALRDSKAL